MMHAATKPHSAPLLATDEPVSDRLRAPRLRPGSVSRVALVNRLRTESAPVLLLVAPAGYGKTTLLAQWAARDPREFTWLRPQDDDPATLEQSVVESLAHSTRVDRRAGRVLVLDSVDAISRPASVDVIRRLCEDLPSGTRLVLSGRRSPRLPLGRLRAEGLLSEISPSDLRLTDREAAALLRNIGVELDAPEVEALNAQCEGWPVGLYLTAIALKARRGKSTRSLDGVTGAHHFIAEYFESEVLERLDRASIEFALGASVLARMAGPICDAVLAEAGSAARIKDLAAAGAFIAPLDREHTWFRFHPQFREMLRTRLQHETPPRFVEVSRRAASWYERAGDLPAAIDYLRAIGDVDEAARVLGEAAEDVIGRGLLDEIEPALTDLFDRHLVEKHRPAAISGALAHALLGRPGEVERWLEAADLDAADAGAWGALLRAMLCRDGVERMGHDASAALDTFDRHTPMHATAALLLGVSALLAGDLGVAESTLEGASELAHTSDAPLVSSLALAELSLIAQADGRWSLGEDLARRALDAAHEFDRGGHPAAALTYVASARSALRNNNWVRAGDDIERVHALLPRLTAALPWLSVQVRLELARAHLTLNDIGAADELSTEIEQLLRKRPYVGTLKTAAFELRSLLDDVRRQPTASVRSLTAAELRLLPLLTTHLTFRQIAQHLYVSRNTIKTQAISVYRKLGASSRTEAIDRAVELGLLRPDGETVERLA